MPAAPSPLATRWTWSDHWGALCARLGWGRMDYRLEPGLYALGDPDDAAPVLVTANYKLSLDHLRRALAGHAVWILVLDTAGINVWCAAGKGSFGNAEVLRRLAASGLDQRVSHRRLILPQLAAPGISAPQLRRACGWQVRWGPIRAADLPAYLAAGQQADATMRRVRFSLIDRLVLTPIELRGLAKPVAGLALALALLTGAVGAAGASTAWILIALCCAITWLGGALLGPLLLPWVPGRAFALKGALLGLGLSALTWPWWPSHVAGLAAVLVATAGCSFGLLQFTGCSTYTNISGVEREMRWALRLQILALMAGLILWGLAWGWQ